MQGAEQEGKKAELLSRVDRLRDLLSQDAPQLLLEEADWQAARGLGYRKLLLAARYLRAFVYPPSDDELALPDTTTVDWFEALVDHGYVPAEAVGAMLR